MGPNASGSAAPGHISSAADTGDRGGSGLNAQRLCAAARRRTGLDDFATSPLEPALSILVNSLEREARLHWLGRFLMRVHLRDLLETRLRLAADWRPHLAAMDAQKIVQPVFILGMPRSGSTFLHELLSVDPKNRAPRVWEIMFPVERPPGGARDRARRIRKAAACLWWFRRLAPRADSVYPMRAETPHECVAIHSYTFLSEEFISTCWIPSYEAFLHSTDLTPAYVWQRRFLQRLQMGRPGLRWVLKSPDHVRGLDELFAVFPDAYIVQTHRNPLEVVNSSAELTRVLRGLYGPPGELQEVHAREVRILAERTERFMQFRDQHPELADRFIDVKYTELIADPLGTVSRIYRQLEAPLSDVAASQMRELAANRSRYRGPRASADVIDSKALTAKAAFERYCARFGFPAE
jgi:hypothetical protein